MKAKGWDGYFVPAADPHQSEYVPDCWKRREFLSGFTGSFGDLLVGRDHAWLWTDSRYFIQAEEELAETGITLCRLSLAGSPSLEQIVTEFFAGLTIAVDPLTILPRERDRISGALKNSSGTLVFSERNLVDAVWHDQPPLPSSPLEVFPLSCAGLPVMEKLSLLREELGSLVPQGEAPYAHPVTSLDAVAWLFNIRAQDIPFNPLAIAFGLITSDEATLFINETNPPPDVAGHLGTAGIIIRPYDTFFTSLADHRGTWIVDPTTTNLRVFQALEANGVRIIREPSPITLLKAIKNPVEQDGMRDAHRRDAVAVVQLLHWFATAPADEEITELTIADRLEEFRAAQPYYRGPSFPTIAGYGPMGQSFTTAQPRHQHFVSTTVRCFCLIAARSTAMEQPISPAPFIGARHRRRKLSGTPSSSKVTSRSAGLYSLQAPMAAISMHSRALRCGAAASTTATEPVTG